jgi:hypothetical protein
MILKRQETLVERIDASPYDINLPLTMSLEDDEVSKGEVDLLFAKGIPSLSSD